MRLSTMVVAVALLLAPQGARAQSDWPQRPITSIGPLAAGGGADIALRAIATFVKDHLGQPFLATNKPGGGSTAAALEMLSKPADGYTVVALLSAGYVPEVYKFFYDVPYTSKDLVPVIRVGAFPFGLYVSSSSPWKTLADFTRDAKANPGKLAYGHTGRGILLHLTPAAYANAAGIKLREVPTKGASEVLQLLLGKHINIGTSSITAATKYVQSGELRVLAVQSTKREAPFSDTPTMKELGYDFGFPPVALSLFVKAGTSPAIVAKLHDAVKKTLEDPRYIEVAAKAKIPIDYGDAGAIAKDIAAERTAVAAALKDLGMWKD
ncbi:MAG: Bug family tripartite tricarboxylate transporter substrate binding protein [Hyphomicrobiaceae bacterium]